MENAQMTPDEAVNYSCLINVIMPMFDSNGHGVKDEAAFSAKMARAICLVSVGLAMQAGSSSAAMVGLAVNLEHWARGAGNTMGSFEPVLHRVSLTFASVNFPTKSASEAIDDAKRKEIVGIQDEAIKTRKFFELVVLPLGVCFGLVLLLRRGFLR